MPLDALKGVSPWGILILVLTAFLGWIGVQVFFQYSDKTRLEVSINTLVKEHQTLISDVRELREFMAETSSNRYKTKDAKDDFEIVDARIDGIVHSFDSRLDKLTYGVLEIKNTMLTKQDVPPPWVETAIRENTRLIRLYHDTPARFNP